MRPPVNLLILGLIVLVPVTSQAGLVAEESFAYPSGTLDGRSGGTGWSSPWTGPLAGSYVSGGLAYQNGVVSLTATGGSAILYDLVSFSRSLSAPQGSSPSTTYLTFVGQPGLGTSGSLDAFGGLVLLNGANEVLLIGKPPGENNWGIFNLNIGPRTTEIRSDNLALAVVRLDFAATHTTIRLYLNPPLTGEPAESVVGDIMVPPMSFDGIRVLSSTLSSCLVDEIRVGDQYDDVTPDNAPANLPAVRITNARVREGDAGTANASFVVSLSRPSTDPVTVRYSTIDDTATGGLDFTSTNGLVTFAPGQTNQFITVSVLGDTDGFELDERFVVTLSNPTNAVLDVHQPLGSESQGIGIIVEDDAVNADLNAYEPFAYVQTSLANRTGGTGWALGSAWTTVALTSPWSIVGPGLGYNDGLRSLATASNSVQAVGNTLEHARGVGAPMLGGFGQAGTTAYLSFIARVLSGERGGIWLGTGNGTRKFFIGKMPGHSHWGVGAAAGPFSESSALASVQSLLVCRLDFGEYASTLRLYVNPSLDAEPSGAAAIVTLDALHGDYLRNVFLSAGTNATDVRLDEVRLAPTWAQVTPNNVVSRLSVFDAAIEEGDSGTRNMVFTVFASPASGQMVTVNYETASGSATAGSDFSNQSGALTFNPGETARTISVPIFGDSAVEPDESFTLALSNPVNAEIGDGSGLGTILNDDGPPRLVIGPGRVFEGNSGSTQAVFRVRLDRPSASASSVDFATMDGTATAGVDYSAINGTVTFAPGETNKTVSIMVFGDTQPELNETFFVRLSNPMNCALVNTDGPGLIGDDDTPVAATNLTLLSNGNPVPGEPGRVFKQFIDAPVINIFNELAFVASTTDTNGGDVETNLYLWLGPTNELIRIAGTTVEPPDYPNGSAYAGDFAFPNLDDEGNVSFLAGIDPIGAVAGPVHAASITSPEFALHCWVQSLQRVISIARRGLAIRGLEAAGTTTVVGGQNGDPCAQPKHSNATCVQSLVRTMSEARDFTAVCTDAEFGRSKKLISPGDPSPFDPGESAEFTKATWQDSAGNQGFVLRTALFPRTRTTLAIRKADGNWVKLVETGDLLTSGPPPARFSDIDPTPGFVDGDGAWVFAVVIHEPGSGVTPQGIYAFNKSTGQIIKVYSSPAFLESKLHARDNAVVFAENSTNGPTVSAATIDPATGQVTVRRVVGAGDSLSLYVGPNRNRIVDIIDLGTMRVGFRLGGGDHPLIPTAAVQVLDDNGTTWDLELSLDGNNASAFVLNSEGYVIGRVEEAERGSGGQRGANDRLAAFSTWDSGELSSSLMWVPRSPLANPPSTNHPPELVQVADGVAVVGVKLAIPVIASDPDPGQTLSYALSNAPPGMFLATNDATVVICWAPTITDAGDIYRVEVHVFDDGTPMAGDMIEFSVEVPLEADLEIIKTATRDSVEPNDLFTFSLLVTNHSGLSAEGVTVTDPLPPGLEGRPGVESSQGSCEVGNDGLIQCSLGTLPPHGSARIIVYTGARFSRLAADPYFRVDNYTNTTWVCADSPPDPNLDNNRSSVTVRVTPAICDLAISLDVSRDYVSPGSSVPFSIIVSNLGPNVAYSPALEFILADGFSVHDLDFGFPVILPDPSGSKVILSQTIAPGGRVTVTGTIKASLKTKAAVQSVVLRTPYNILVNPTKAVRSVVLHSDIELSALGIEATRDGEIGVSWSGAGTLQESTNPADLSDWKAVAGAPTSPVTIPTGDRAKYYRLIGSPPPPLMLPIVQVYGNNLVLDGVRITDASAGEVCVFYQGSPNPQYLNLNLNGTHVVQDWPLLSLGGPDQPQNITIHIDLPPGVEGTVNYGFTLTPTPTATNPPVTFTEPKRFRDLWEATGLGGQQLTNIRSALITGGLVIQSAQAKPTFPNRNQGVNECGVYAVANSLEYLNDLFGLNLAPDLYGPAALKEALRWTPSGVPLDWVFDKQAYLEEHNLPVTSFETHLAPVAAESLRQCCAVEVEMDGHLACLVGIADLPGDRSILYLADDSDQSRFGGTHTYSVLWDQPSGILIGSKWARYFHRFVVQCAIK